ncbi:THUMP domain-containing protein 2 isoform X2 [Mugil cephalus]|uniref:THUMP domain-containing protein 2 isoform X2 n=1 Tax=Mugil cephalus TaxID=48193 RepID=UPI001FB6E3B1|nr:THUMP domain-containing protein 2 isoform X2 [Mugil cephalus]
MMSESISEGSVVRYYCTAGSGMEPFLIDEVKRKLAAQDVYQMPGKVLFSSSAAIHKVSNLKAAERLFLLLKQDSPLRLSVHTSPAKAASMLQSRLLDDKNQWTSAVLTWSRLQGELTARRTTVKTSTSALGVIKRRGEERGSDPQETEEGNEREEQREEWEKCLVKSRKSEGEQREEESGNGRLRSGEQNGTQTLEKKRKRHDEEEVEEKKRTICDSSNKKNAEKVKMLERERRTEEVDRTQMELSSDRNKITEKGPICDHAIPGLEHNVASRKMTDDINTNFVTESVENVRTAGEGDTVPLKTCKDKPEQPSCIPVTFRISCKCTGSTARCLGTQEVSKVIGVSLCRLLGWKADLKNPELEINIYLSDDHCLLGIPLTRLPLANRSYIKTTGLRSTVAWAMASLAHIKPGFRVVDPMCGVGTILMEAAQEHEEACFLGVDIDDGQLQKASENVAFAELGNRIHLLRASSMKTPPLNPQDSKTPTNKLLLSGHPQKTHVHSLMSHNCFGGTRETYTILGSATSAQLQCRLCSLRPAVWQEVWHQNQDGCQSATHPH